MKKQNIFASIFVLLIFLMLVQFAAAAPPWKKNVATTVPATTTTTAPTANVPPQITSISLKPDPVNIDGTVKCSVTPFDSNGDPVKVSYRWSATGRCNLSKAASSAIDLSTADCEEEGDVITCIATPNDGKVNGISAQESITVSSKSFNWEMVGVILIIIGALVGWLISRRVRGKTATYMSEIDKVYRTYNKNSNKCEAELTHIREKIEDDFKKGKINDQSLSILESRIDKYSKELRSEIVSKRFALPEDLNRRIKHMLSDGIITKEEYGHFKEVIAKTDMGARDKEEISGLMKKWKDEDKR